MPGDGRIKIPFTLGVNKRDDPRRIKDEELVQAENLQPTEPGTIETREGLTKDYSTPALYTWPGMVGSNLPQAPNVLWINSHLASPFTDLEGIAAVLTQPSDNWSTWAFIKDDGTVGNHSGLIDYAGTQNEFILRPERAPVQFVFNGKIYMLPGASSIDINGDPIYNAGNPMQWMEMSRDDGAPAITSDDTVGGGTKIERKVFAGLNNDTAYPPRVAATYRSRVVWANFAHDSVGASEPFARYIVMSDDYDPETIGDDAFAANGRAFALPGTGPGDEIMAMVEIMQNEVGSPGQSALLVLLKHSAYLITGELDQSDGTGADDLVVSRLSMEANCVGHWAVIHTPHGVFWVGDDDIWGFDIGQLPRRLGSKIRSVIQRTANGSALASRIRMAYRDNMLRVSLPGEEQDTDTDSPQTLTASDLVQLEEEWLLDLERGIPPNAEEAAWWGPLKFPSRTALDTVVDGVPYWFVRVDGGFRGLTGSDNSGDLQFAAQSLDVTYDDRIDDAAEAGPGISIDLKTKFYDGEEAAYQKLVIGTFANLNVYQAEDTSGLLKSQFIVRGPNTTFDVEGKEYVGDDSAAFPPDDPEPVAFYPAAGDRPVASFIQFRMYTEDQYMINETNNVLLIVGPEGDLYRASITEGIYPSLAALMAQIQADLRAITDFDVGTTVALNTGLVEIVEPNAGGFVTIGLVWNIPGAVLHSGGTASAEDNQKSTALGTLLGWDTSGTNTMGVGNTITAEAEAEDPNGPSPWLNLSGLELYLELIPRTP